MTAPSGPRAPTDGPDEWLDGGAPPSGAGRRRRPERVAAVAIAVLALMVLGAPLLWPDAHHVDAPENGPLASPASARPHRPGALSVSTRALDLGSTLTSGSFGIANTGDLPVLYQVSSRTSWMGVEPIGGQLGAQSGRRIDLRVDRDAVPEGRATGTIVVNWDGGRVVVRVHLTQGRGPTPPRSATGSR